MLVKNEDNRHFHHKDHVCNKSRQSDMYIYIKYEQKKKKKNAFEKTEIDSFEYIKYKVPIY